MFTFDLRVLKRFNPYKELSLARAVSAKSKQEVTSCKTIFLNKIEQGYSQIENNFEKISFNYLQHLDLVFHINISKAFFENSIYPLTVSVVYRTLPFYDRFEINQSLN
jgi:hypothetical protein